MRSSTSSGHPASAASGAGATSSAARTRRCRATAAAIREGGSDGMPGVRALGLHLERRDVVQVSTNIEDHRAVTATDVLAAVSRRHPVVRAELVAPAPQAALAGWPAGVDLRMPATIEALLGR